MKSNNEQYCSLSFESLLNLREPASRLNFLPRTTLSIHEAGSHLAKSYGHGMEFAEVRTYQAGDDIRSIDWNVTARRGSAHTKLYHTEQDQTCMIIVSQQNSMQFASRGIFKSVMAGQVASLLAWAANGAGLKLGSYVTYDHTLHCSTPNQRQKSVLSLIQNLTNPLTPYVCENDSFLHAVSLCQKQLTSNSIVFLIADFLCCNQEMLINYIAPLVQHHQVILCQILDTLEKTTPAAGCYTLGNKNQQYLLDLTTPKQRKLYEEHMHKLNKPIKTLVNTHRCSLWSFDTNDDVIEKLTNYCLG